MQGCAAPESCDVREQAGRCAVRPPGLDHSGETPAAQADVTAVVPSDYPVIGTDSMSTVATSLKIPARMKKRVETVAKRTGLTAHAFMLRAIETELETAERFRRFIDDALAAEKEMLAGGKGIALDEARAYFEAIARGKPVARPRPRRWRK
jgi:predicted DNA-binding protein